LVSTLLGLSHQTSARFDRVAFDGRVVAESSAAGHCRHWVGFSMRIDAEGELKMNLADCTLRLLNAGPG
jgi:hypothetical protein